jgi:NAD(P)-dependent dehydrogenase (short-subunit alcohol dehydrogenase family)
MGRAIATDLARQGLNVVVTDKYMIPPTVRSENTGWGGLEEIAEDIEKLGSKGLAVQADVSVPGDCEMLVGKIMDEFGRLDYFVNAVGLRGPSGVLTADIPIDAWKQIIDVNMNGAFYLSKYVIKAMLKEEPRGKKIVFIASQAGVEGVPGMCGYSTAKHGLIGIMKSLSKELAPMGINVNAISPLTFDTNFRDATAAEEAAKEGISVDEIIKKDSMSRGTNANNVNIPLGRNGTVEDAAAMISFLLSTASDYVAGQNILMNGGNMSL